MAKEIQALAATGQTLYAQVFRVTDGAIWNTAGTPAFETYATANIADYDIAMAEAGTASGYYTGNLPALAAGTYSVVVRVRAGGSPAETDIPVSVGTIHWDGSAVIDVASVYSRLGAPAGASIAADLVTIDNFVDDLEGRLTATRAGYLDNLSAGAVATAASIASLNNISTAQVNAEVDTALADINLDHLVKIAVDTDFATTVHINSVIGQLADNGTSATFDRTTDSLEAIRDRGDAAWITATGFSTLTQADVRAAVGLASANLDTQLDALPTNAELATALDSADDAMLAQIALVKAQTDLLPASPAAVGSAMTLTSGERDSIAAAILDLAAGVETNLTPRQLLRLLAAVIAGKSSGGGGTYRDYNDTKNRIVATLDGSSNRTAVTRDVS